MPFEDKIKSREELKEIVMGLQKEGKKVVFTNGCFDLMHEGHATYLQEARSYGDALVVGMNTDDSVRRIKGPKRPIIPESSRAKMMAALECVSYVTFFDESTPEKLIEYLKPDIHVKGADWKIENIPEAKIVFGYGGQVKLTKVVPGFSTTNIIKKIIENYKEDMENGNPKNVCQ